MIFNSTRDKSIQANSYQAILGGLAPDGGLYVPETIKKIKDLEELLDLSYIELAAYIIGQFFDEFSQEEMLEITKNAYGSRFPKEPVALKTGDNFAFIELFHGRTQAFKDMALSILPYLMVESMKKSGEDSKIAILVATSGDTGKAALEGFKDVDGTHVIVFYPQGGVSKVQYLQMASQEGDNLDVLAIEGNFDDAQRTVKEIFLDQELKDQIQANGYKFSSANSINIGRLVPQIVYYIYSYLELVRQEKIRSGDKVNIVVPTGNFGNILASYYASLMGFPVNDFILASNENNVLVDFFRSGEYDANRDLILTSSPSMDILVSSNLERFLYHISEEDTKKVKEAMEALEENRRYSWDINSVDNFYANYADEDDISKSIQEIDQKLAYVIDPHTGVAYSTYKKYLNDTKDDHYTLIASTASPYKFPGKVLDSLGLEKSSDDLENLKILEEYSGLSVPKPLGQLSKKDILHDKVVGVDQMDQAVLEILSSDSND